MRATMTWGTLPSPEDFEDAFSEICGEGGDYSIREGAAAGTLPEGVCSGDYNSAQVWEMLEWLTADANLGGDHDPGGRKGDLASGILGTLGFEWV